MAADLKRGIERENEDFRDYLSQCAHPVPQDYYTNKLFKSARLNSCFIWLNKMVIFLFFNLINASMQSTGTVIRRRMFKEYDDAERRRTSRVESCAGAESSGEVSNDLQEQAKATLEPGLSFPEHSYPTLLAFLLMQSLIWSHYVIAEFVLNDPTNKKYAITCSRQLSTYQTLVHAENSPVSLIDAASTTGEVETVQQLNSCLNHLELYLSERYDKFYVWNMSISSFNSTITINYLIVEQSEALQMFSQEVTLFCHTISSFFISTGVLSCVLGEIKPYDVAALVYVYDPRYSAYHIKSRLRYYLDTIRASYQNYWSIYHLDQNYNLCKCLLQGHRKLDDIREGNNLKLFKVGQPSSKAIVSSLSSAPTSVRRVETNHFDEYIPSARSEAWRLVLMKASPVFLVSTTLVVTITLTIMYVFFVSDNDEAVLLNSELRRFLLDETTPLGFDEAVAQHCALPAPLPSSATNGTSLISTKRELTKFVQAKIVAHLSGVLRKLSPDLSMSLVNAAGHVAGEQRTALGTTNNKLADEAFQLNRQLVVDSIKPLVSPTLANWTVPIISGLVSGLLFSLYFVIFFSVIGDLCFWLFEIRMKLDICKVLFKHYNDLAVDQRNGGLVSLSPTPLPSIGPFRSQLLASTRNVADLMSKYRNLPGPECMFHEVEGAEFEKRHLADSNKLAQGQGLLVARPRSSVFPTRRGPASSHSATSHRSVNSKPVAVCNSNSGADSCAARSLRDYGGGAAAAFSRLPPNDLEQAEIRRECISKCNVRAWDIIHYIMSSRSRRRLVCESYARDIIQNDAKLRDRFGFSKFQQGGESFLLSAYLDFRLFLEQIDNCRFSINFMLGFTVLHALNIIASSQLTDLLRSKIGFMGTGYVLANITLIGSSFFQSQSTKLISPINSILASSLNGDRTIKHLAALWHRALVDLAGSRSKFSFRMYSVNITYATALQFNLGVTSLYILTLDKIRYRA